MSREIKLKRETKETKIECHISLPGTGDIQISTTIPFFDHMLNALFFHGNFNIKLIASGDTDVDEHHLIEDCGIVIGEALKNIFEQNKKVARYGEKTVPMDDALALAVVDFCNRPFLVYKLNFPQLYCGDLDTSLFKEFFYALAINAKINLHLVAQYGENSHHIIEATFKATGKSLAQSLEIKENSKIQSTKGEL